MCSTLLLLLGLLLDLRGVLHGGEQQHLLLLLVDDDVVGWPVRNTSTSKGGGYAEGKEEESDTCLDVYVVGEEHGHAVDTHAPTGGGRETILERGAENVVDELSLIVTLRIESKA